MTPPAVTIKGRARGGQVTVVRAGAEAVESREEEFIKEFLQDFGRLMRENEGRVTGKFDLAFPNEGPDGSAVHVSLVYPDWSSIGSVPAKR
jgi:hypothetical protein